jgi:hypothetical protein
MDRVGYQVSQGCIYETSMIRLTQTKMKIHHASSIRFIKSKLFSDES